jgi:hypothetical protein
LAANLTGLIPIAKLTVIEPIKDLSSFVMHCMTIFYQEVKRQFENTQCAV